MDVEQDIPVILRYLIPEERKIGAYPRNPSNTATKVIQQVDVSDDVFQDGNYSARAQPVALPAVAGAGFNKSARKMCLPDNTLAEWQGCNRRSAANSISLTAAPMVPGE